MSSADGTVRVYSKIVGDLFHTGHIRFLRAARELGTHLTVCVVPDDRVAVYKGRAPVFTQEERLEIVESCRWVDAVISDGPRVITREFMTANAFDLYAFGASDEAELARKLADCPDLPEGMRCAIPYHSGISSTMIRERVLRGIGGDDD